MHGFPLFNISEVGVGLANGYCLTIAIADGSHHDIVLITCTCVNLVALPSGMTRQLHPLDICQQIVKRPFKEGILLLLSESNLLTTFGKIKHHDETCRIGISGL